MDRDEIKLAIKEAFDEEIKPFYIDREQHFKDHEKTQSITYEQIAFLSGLIRFTESLKDAFWKTMVKVITVFVLSAATGGIFLWLKYHK